MLDFPAKGGIQRSVTLVDAPLAQAVRDLRRARTGNQRLFVYRGPTGWLEVHSEHLNERFKELAGIDYTVKDLRTGRPRLSPPWGSGWHRRRRRWPAAGSPSGR